MFTAFGCCSARLKGAHYRSDGGPGSFPFVRDIRPNLIGSSSTSAFETMGNLLILVVGCSIRLLSPTVHDGEICTLDEQCFDLSSEMAKLYPYLACQEQSDNRLELLVVGHTGVQCKLLRVTLDTSSSPSTSELFVPANTIFDSDCLTCAVTIRSISCVLCGSSTGSIAIVSIGDNFGKREALVQPQFSIENACITDMKADSRFLFVATDEVPEVVVYRYKPGSHDLVHLSLISLVIPTIIFPLQIKSLIRPFASYSVDSLDKPSGSLFIRTDRLIARYSFESSCVVSYEVCDTRHLFLGPFDNGPLMSIDLFDDRISVWENVCGRLRRSSEAIVDGIMRVAVSSNREVPRLFMLTRNETGQEFIESWTLRK